MHDFLSPFQILPEAHRGEAAHDRARILTRAHQLPTCALKSVHLQPGEQERSFGSCSGLACACGPGSCPFSQPLPEQTPVSLSVPGPGTAGDKTCLLPEQRMGRPFPAGEPAELSRAEARASQREWGRGSQGVQGLGCRARGRPEASERILEKALVSSEERTRGNRRRTQDMPVRGV